MAKPVIIGILPFISVILGFKSVFLARSLVPRIFLSASLIFFSKSDLSVVLMLFTLATNLSYSVFLTTSFLLHHLVCLSQQEQVLIYQYLIYLLQFLN